MACQSVTQWKGAPVVTSSSARASVVLVSTVICIPFSVVWSSILVMKDRAEVCPLSREVMLSLYPTHYRTAFAFSAFLYPLSHRHTLRLPTASGRYRAYRVLPRYPNGLGPLYSPVALHVHERASKIASARHGAFWPKPVSILGLFPVTTFIKHLHSLTIPLTLASDPL